MNGKKEEHKVLLNVHILINKWYTAQTMWQSIVLSIVTNLNSFTIVTITWNWYYNDHPHFTNEESRKRFVTHPR